MRHFLLNSIKDITMLHEEIISTNVVGSFADQEGLAGIGDIDTIVIVDHLSEVLYKNILGNFIALKDELLASFGYNLKVNPTFGPLKFNDQQTVVFHVMIYDVYGHMMHCLQSPFTCYDWQRTKIYFKKHMKDIYKVKRLMPSHFFNSRRSSKEYLSDFENSRISYREYCFEDGKATISKKFKQMTNRDRFEFAYHIVKFICRNFMKCIRGKNELFSIDESLENAGRYWPISSEVYQFMDIVQASKESNIFPEDSSSIGPMIWNFLDSFESRFASIFSRNIYFVRHAPTNLNAGTNFIGQRSDPSILENPSPVKNVCNTDKIYSSVMARSKQSARSLFSNMPIECSELLSEIDYGDADGHDFQWLKENYPEIISQWNMGLDPRFPDGENYEDISKRVELFVEKLLVNKTSYVVTHNVWLRCLIGMYFKIPRSKWHLISIPHNHLFKFKGTKDSIYPDFSESDLKIVFSQIDRATLESLYLEKDSRIYEKWHFWSKFRMESIQCSSDYSIPGICVIPMAGEGKRFQNAGYKTPKPLIDIDGKMMIQRTLDSLPRVDKVIYVLREQSKSQLEPILLNSERESEIVSVDFLTTGQTSTTLLGLSDAESHRPLLISSCDNSMSWDRNNFDELINDPTTDMVCWTFSEQPCIDEKPQSWGYVKTDNKGLIRGVSVKKPMTDSPFHEHCIIGTFWFRSVKLFKDLAESQREQKLTVNGEYYIDSLIEIAIKEGYRVRNFMVQRYISWGRPEDLDDFRCWRNLSRFGTVIDF